MLGVQLIPSLDVKITLLSWLPPTATKTPFPNATLCRFLSVPEFLDVHLTPSVEVRTIPASPTATYLSPPQTMPVKLADIGALTDRQNSPSGEIRISPLPPKMTNMLFPNPIAANRDRNCTISAMAPSFGNARCRNPLC